MSEPIITKRCPKCKEVKPLSDFYKDRSKKTGKGCYCKICNNNRSNQYQTKAYRKHYQQTEKGKVACCSASRHYRINNPKKARARNAISRAVVAGRLPKIKTLQCYLCFKPAQHYHHYLGYEPEHWLDVLPVCAKCHKEIP